MKQEILYRIFSLNGRLNGPMSSITDTRTQTTFHRTNPSSPREHAIFVLQDDPSRPGVTQITLPEKSTWTPGPHWHESYIEYFKVLKGRVLVKLDGVSRIVIPEDGPIKVDKFVVHEFMRTDRDRPDDEKDDGEVITEEWTDPADGQKHIFFRNVFSILQDQERHWGRWAYLQALFTVSHYDNFILIAPGNLAYPVAHALYAGVKLVGWMAGLKPWIVEYTPNNLKEVAVKTADSKLW